MSTEQTEGTDYNAGRAYLEGLGKVAPGLAVGAALLYALGLYSAYRMDATLGIGTVEVSRERAICLGIALLIQVMPVTLFWLNVRENMTEAADSNLWMRVKVTLNLAVFPGIVSGLLTIALTAVCGVTPTAQIWFSTLFPVALLISMLIQSASNVRRLVVFWPLFAVILLGFIAPLQGAWLPCELGGHSGKKIQVLLKDGKSLAGILKTSDSRVLVLGEGNTVRAISRDEIASLESVVEPK